MSESDSKSDNQPRPDGRKRAGSRPPPDHLALDLLLDEERDEREAAEAAKERDAKD